MSAVQEVLSWWGAQLCGLVPARLRPDDLHAAALIADIRPGDAAITLAERRKRREIPLGAPDSPRARALLTARRRPRRVLVRVPGSAVLERPLVLPLAAEPELGRVVAYEIDRISPFSSGEVAWTWAIERRDRTAGKLHLRIALLPRAALEGGIARLQELGVTPSAALAPRSGGGDWRIGLTPPGQASGRARSRALIALSAVCALLALAAAALPFVRQDAAIRHEEARIAQLRPGVAQAEALRRRVADRAGGLDAVAAESARVGQALNVLATLTALLPDNTYLTSLSLRQRTLTLAGRSTSAARLIPLLAADPAFRNAAFAAPVTRADGVRGDVFSIRAEFGS